MKAMISPIILVLVLFSCTTEKIDRSSFVQEETEKKLMLFRVEREEACREEMLEEINMEVDSMMYFLVKKMKGESGEMPSRPIRPKRLVDTISLIERPQ